MAYFKGSVYSETLKMRSGLSVVTPKHCHGLRDDPPKAVFLLHGLSDNCDDWTVNCPLPMLADRYRLSFFMPEVQRSFYTDMAFGPPYFSYVSEELPRLCAEFFPLTLRREDTFVMGLSMGGYGALKCALTHPEEFGGCAAFSAACDLEEARGYVPDALLQEMRGVFGMALTLSEKNDLQTLARCCAALPVPEQPRLFLTCGTEDFLHAQNVRFSSLLKELGLPAVYREGPGAHEWGFWTKSLEEACAHFFRERTEP